ncbi:MAG: hypothetical protein PUA60_06710 [Methanobacteriaceae archaeon]|nr:hypothetical protein [Methanobacteriaceae archaeon]
MQDNRKYIAPPWIKYPTTPKNSSFWKTGTGAEYLVKYNKQIENRIEYEKLFPVAPTFASEISPSESLNDDTVRYLTSKSKPLFIKLWREDGKPKYDLDVNNDGENIFMYDTIYKDTSYHIHIGTGTYSSVKEIIELSEEDFSDKPSVVWDQLKYTVYLNALYYKIIADINFTRELIKTGDHPILFKSDNLEFGIIEDDGKYRGHNYFGLAMMEIRDVVKDVFKNYDMIDWDISGQQYSKERCMCNHLHNTKI